MKNIKPFLLLLSLTFCGQLFSQVEIKNLTDINSDELDFSPMPFGNGIMYTSSKSDRFLSCPTYGDSYVDLYYAEKKADGTWDEPIVLKGKVNGKYNDGVPAFYPGGERMVFTRNNLKGKDERNIIDLKLYNGHLVDGTWVDATEEFPIPNGFVNNDGWSSAHPAISNDGNLIIFASNRPGSTLGPDGEPSMDLWAVRMENGVWSLPFNLGPNVNTAKNEIFPTLNENGALFFSSNGHPGEGGLDIFAALPGTGDEWELVGNVGAPFNTPSDDMSFIALNDGTEGYLASDRAGSNAKGRDDIYEWTREPEFIDAIIQVVDKNTLAPLPNSDLSIDPGTFKNESMVKYGPVLDKIFGGETGGDLVLESGNFKTDDEGKVKIRILANGNFNILASNQPLGYKDATRNPTSDDLTSVPVYVIPLEKAAATLTVRIVEDNPYQARIPGADIKIVNRRTNEVINLVGDNGGEGSTQILCDDDYVITASKPSESYIDSTVILSEYKLDFKEDCQDDGKVLVIIPLRKLNIVYLEPIFFNFDRYYIRSRDAKPTLDSLVTILNTYPSLHVQLEGNTDSRGSKGYNVGLSTRRAKSAKKYLVNKDIAEERLSTDWFGETKLFNNCDDDASCTEADHQLNRRVDVVAVKHDEKNVKFVTRPISEMNVISDRK